MIAGVARVQRGSAMTHIFLVSAVVGGVLLAFQLVLSVFGLTGGGDAGGSDHDFHFDHHGGGGGGDHSSIQAGAAWLLGFVTFRNIVAGLTFFGLIGLATTSAGWKTAASVGAAAGAGLGAMLLVGLAMRGIFRLQDDGTLDIRAAVGQTGTVYVAIPGKKAGAGKVQIDLQNRTAEYQAVTFADSLNTGSKVVVVDVVGPDTLEVIAAPQYGRMTQHA
jgi:hypothetical protein